MEKIDCFANIGKRCICLNEKYCKKEECNFYKNNIQISLSKIENDIINYADKLRKWEEY